MGPREEKTPLRRAQATRLVRYINGIVLRSSPSARRQVQHRRPAALAHHHTPSQFLEVPMGGLTPLQLFLLAIVLPVFLASLIAWFAETAYDHDPEPQ